ncbi:MAG TPA: hypothetical protein VFS11_05950 [Gemmatimonadales bacterium]|nr:hypothetical protein [Gemmatimonadales bacterium]
MAAVQRANDSIAVWEAWRDTLPESRASLAAKARASLPVPVAAAARRCGARFAGATAPLNQFAPFLSLFLAADRDRDAATLLARRLKGVAPDAERERAAVLDTAIAEYLGLQRLAAGPEVTVPLFTQPGRLAEAETLLAELSQLKSVTWQTRTRGYLVLASSASTAGDTARAQRARERLLRAVSTLTAAERRTNEFQELLGPLYQTTIQVNAAALLDSLRHSTSAYLALQRALWQEAAGNIRFPLPIGEVAPPIEAEFWFRRNDTTVARPIAGKVNLVVFLNQIACFGINSRPTCERIDARLRRLAQRFPALEITLVAQTRGFFSFAAPPAPGEEAALLQRSWLGERRLPGVLAVSTTDFWRLPAPDRRRIDRPTANASRYSFGRTAMNIGAQWQGVPSFLVDESGTIVHALNDIDESVLPDLIEILLARQLANRQ